MWIPSIQRVVCDTHLSGVQDPLAARGGYMMLSHWTCHTYCQELYKVLDIAVAVLPGTHYHLSQVKHLKVKYLAQWHTIETMAHYFIHDTKTKIDVIYTGNSLCPTTCKAKRQYMLTLILSKYCLLNLQSSLGTIKRPVLSFLGESSSIPRK